MARLTVTADKQAMSEAAAERITSIVESTITTHGSTAIALTGGSTPDVLYQLLADPQRPWRARIDWMRLHVFWGDEREVPPDHPESNYGLAYRLLLSHVPVPEAQIHRMRGELPATDAGHRYDAVLRLRRGQTADALFDVQLLGIGENVHIASLFPDSPLLAAREAPIYTDSAGRLFTGRLAAGVQVPQLNAWRITLTPRALLDSAHVIMIAAERSKAEAVWRAIEGDEDVTRYPAQLLRCIGDRVEWFIDRAAAARLHDAPHA
jgi:6-phosphogluconolactonase